MFFLREDLISCPVRLGTVAWRAIISSISTPRLFRQFDDALWPAIAASVPKRQAEFLAGRICATAALSLAGLGRATILIGKHRSPRWPNGVVGSITHAGCYSAAAVIRTRNARGIGIDIESIIDEETAASLEHTVVSRAEIERLLPFRATLDWKFLLTLIFSAKESFFKAAYPQVGAYFDFDAVELIEIAPYERRLNFRCVQVLSPELKPGYSFSVFYEELVGGALITSSLLP